MIITASLTENDFRSLPREEACVFLEELARVHRSGTHIVVLDRKITDWALSNPLSLAAIASYKRISSEYSQLGALTREADFKLVLQRHTQSGRRESNDIHLSISDFLQSRVMEKAVVLVENIRNDSVIYDLIVSVFKEIMRIPSVNYEYRHGQGEDIIEILRHESKERRVVAVVIDSDRRTPFCKCVKETRIQELIASTSWPCTRLNVTPGREAENLLSIDAICSLDAWTSNPSSPTIRSIMARSDAISEEFWMFFDVKNGSSTDERRKVNAPLGVQWLARMQGELGIKDINFSGFGDKILSQFKVSGKAQECQRLYLRRRTLPENIKCFGRSLVWTVASKPGYIT